MTRAEKIRHTHRADRLGYPRTDRLGYNNFIENAMREIAWEAWRKAYEKQMDVKFEGTPYFGIYPLVGERISFDEWYDKDIDELEIEIKID